MMKISFILMLGLATITLTPASPMDMDIMAANEASGKNILNILSILLNPQESWEQKLSEILLNREFAKLAENDESVNLSLGKVNTLDVAYVMQMNADLIDAQNATKNYNVTIAIRFMQGVTDFTFTTAGEEPIVKEIKW